MDKKKIWSYIDHTLLKPESTWEQVDTLCAEAAKYGAASVCVPPCFVARIKNKYGGKVDVDTVVGFPLGYSTTEAKAAETAQAVAEGADEIDMVINIGWAKEGEFDKITEEINAVHRACAGKPLKVIIETCYLTDKEKIRLCRCVTEAGAEYIKTSTGFGPAGATLHDIELFKKHIGPDVKIKAAGGISTLEDIEAYIAAGCARIGSSRGVKILEQ
jgi:deoxyribose-phosphate aldolase